MITEVLSENSLKWGLEEALAELDPATGERRRLSWREFDSISWRVANGLKNAGIAKGDRVILLAKNCLEWLPVYFGILRSGAWVVPLNHRFSREEALWCAETAGARGFFFGEEFEGYFEKGEGGADTPFVSIGRACNGAESLSEYIASLPDTPFEAGISLADEAGLYFTSGTTGRPKPILLTHANLFSACLVEQAHHGQTHDDNFLLIPPLYHTGAKMHWFGNFLVGARAVILKGAKPEWIIKAVSDEKCTIVWLLVPWAQDILDSTESGKIRLTDFTLGQWRLMHIGAQPVPPSLVKRWLEVFPKHSYDTNYGLSEATGPGAVHLGVGNTHKVGAIGVPGHGYEIRIVHPESFAEVARGEVGELLVRGPGVMRCYYKNPEATANALTEDGWLHTGDLARVDEDGFCWLVDRKKDLIIVGGENVFPVEVEDFLRSLPKVRDAAAIGAPHRRLGEAVVAVIDLLEGESLTEAEILQSCKALPGYKRPHRVYFGEVPRNPTGKIEKPKLRERYSREIAD